MGLRLDEWLKNLGLWRGFNHNGEGNNAASIETQLAQNPYILTGTDYDEDRSLRMISVKSETRYDEETGIFEDKLIYWRHRPSATSSAAKTKQDQDIIYIRGKRLNTKDKSGNAQIAPDLIRVGGKEVFNASKGDDASLDKNVRLINRITALSGRVKQHLNDKKPARDLAKILSGGANNGNLLNEITDGVHLYGLDDKGGFKGSIAPFFLDAAQMNSADIRFTNCDIDQLKTMLGFVTNTLEPSRNHTSSRSVIDAETQSGVRFETGIEYEHDEKAKRHIFRVAITPQDLSGAEQTPPSFDIAKLTFNEEDESTFKLDQASFMQKSVGNFQKYEDGLNLIGFMQGVNKHLSNWQYPPYRDLITRYRLTDHLQGVQHKPPTLAEGGETLFLTINGSSLEKKADVFGDGIGGGNMIMHRGIDENGEISEVAAVIGFPFATGGPNSDWDGMNADFLPYWDSIKAIFIDHDHYDHSTIEFYASKGWLRDKTIYTTPANWDIMKTRMSNLKVPKEWQPKVEYLKDSGALSLKDEAGNTRLWCQYCENATVHSARVTGFMFTGCMNDDHYDDTFLFYNDGIDLTTKGWNFANEGPAALAKQKGVSAEKVNDKKIDVVLHDPTGVASGGYAPRPKDVKKTFRGCLDILKDKTVVAVPFSTNHIEIQSLEEVWAEQDYLRNFTFVGANPEIRARIMNSHGIPNFDLTKKSVPRQKIPGRIFRIVIDATDARITAIESRAAVKDRKLTAAERRSIRFYKKLKKDSLKSIANGDTKPDILFRGFLSNKEFSKDIDSLTLKPEQVAHDLEELKQHTRRLIKSKREDLVEILKEQKAEPDSKTVNFIMRTIYNHGEITFNNSGHTSYAMYNAIMAGQEDAAIYASRQAKKAKKFKENPGKLGVISSAPTGTAEEHFGSLPRFAWYWSLFDVDEETRNTGYSMDAENMVFFVTQPGPPGSEASQARLMQEVVDNRDVTIFCAIKNGFKVYNPKDKLGELMTHFKSLGWNASYNATTNQIEVLDQPFHFHGHGFYNDFVKMVEKVPADLHEIIHITDRSSFDKAQQAIKEAKKKSTIQEPEDHVAYRVKREKDGTSRLEATDYMQHSYWLVRLRRQYGRQFGGIVEMLRAFVQRSDGKKNVDGLDVRTDGDGEFLQKQATRHFNDFMKPEGDKQSARQRNMGPSEAEIQEGNGKPRGRMVFRPRMG